MKTGQHAQIGMDLWVLGLPSGVADMSAVEDEISFLATLSVAGMRKGRAEMALAMMLDVAKLEEDDGSISGVFITVRPLDNIPKLLDLLSERVPIMGLELLNCWAKGIFAVHIATEYRADDSFHGALANGAASNHEKLALRQAAQLQLETHRALKA